MSHFDFESFTNLLTHQAKEVREGMTLPRGTEAFLMEKSAEVITRMIRVIEDVCPEGGQTMRRIHHRIMEPSDSPTLSSNTPPTNHTVPPPPPTDQTESTP